MPSILLPPRYQKPALGAQIDWNHPLSRGLVWFPLFNEGIGATVNDLAKGNNATWQGTLGSQWAASQRGTTGKFNGTNNYLKTTAITPFALPGSITLACWFQRGNTTATSYALLGRGAFNGGNGPRSYGLYLNGANGLSFAISGDGTAVTLLTTASNTVTDTRWHHVAGTFRSVGAGTSVLTIYLDGVQAATVSTGPVAAFDANQPLYIGAMLASGNPAWFWNGLIDAPMIYNRALSDSDIARLYQEPYCMIAAPAMYRYFSPSVGFFASDTFTGTAGTVLDGRTADLGGAWTRNTNTGVANVAVLDSANAARVNIANTDTYYYLPATPPSANYDVQADYIKYSAVGDFPQILLRMSTTAKTAYTWEILSGGTNFQFNRIVAGAATTLGATGALSYPPSPLGRTVRITVRTVGGQVQLAAYLDGCTTAALAVTDASPPAALLLAGFAGISFYSNPSGTDSTGVHVDNFVAQAAATMTPSPTYLSANNTATVTVTNTGTNWTGGTTFSLSGGTGASITAQSITGQVATLTINPGSAAGRLVISDGLGGFGYVDVTALLTIGTSHPAIIEGGAFTNTSTAGETYRAFSSLNCEQRIAFTGTKLEANAIALGGSTCKISIDGAAATTITPTTAFNWITLASGLADALHVAAISQPLPSNNLGFQIDQSYRVTGSTPALSRAVGFEGSPVLLDGSTSVYIKGDTGSSVVAGVNGYANITSFNWDNGSISFRARCSTLKVWMLIGTSNWALTIDGVEQPKTSPTANAPAWGWLTLGTGLDDTTYHNYRLTVVYRFGGTFWAYQVLAQSTTGGTVDQTYRPVFAPQNILGFGDSITESVQDASDCRVGYVHQVALSLKAEESNRGINGTTMHDFNDGQTNHHQQSGEFRVHTDISTLTPVPTVILDLYGTNDFAQQIGAFGGTPSTFQTACYNVYSDILTTLPTAHILAIGMLDRCDCMSAFSPSNAALRTQYVQGKQAAVASIKLAFPNANIQFLDSTGWITVLPGALNTPSVDTTDGLHPNTGGHLKITAKLLAYLRTRFQRFDMDSGLFGMGGRM